MKEKMKQETSQGWVAGAEDVRWNLKDLYASVEELDQDIADVQEQADVFASCKGQLGNWDAAQIASALQDYEKLHDRIGRAYTYAYLHWTTETTAADRGALLQRVREAYNRINQTILFFELEWIGLEDDKADRLMQDERLSGFLHYLRLQRRMRPHVLSEAEERVLAEKSITGRAAWNRFFDETMGSSRFPFRGQDLTEQEVLAKLHDTDRQLRRDAALALTEGLRRHLRENTFVFNTILADKASEDRLRNYPHWLSSRNLANQVSDEAANNLIETVCGRFDLVARFYRLKRKLLGLDELFDYDRYAPIEQTDTRYSWEEASQIVLRAYGEFHPKMSAIASRFFDRNWIDAPVQPGKRGGAFSHSAVPSAHPYIFLNYTGRVRDVQTLAHEMGHGVHQYLARKQGILQSDTPLTMAETASVFGEMLVFQSLLKKESSPANRLSMLIGKIDDTIATVFRQISMNRFEDRIHQGRRNQGELSSDRFCQYWIEQQNEMFQGSVTLGNHYRFWWSYIPHFIHTPGYVYAYAFGELLVLALFARYQEEGDPFSSKYVQLLASGGSDWPHVQTAKLGVDLQDSGFWKQGLQAIEELIRQAEELAEGQPAPPAGDSMAPSGTPSI